MKDKKNSSNCEFAESIVTYMYGELPIGEQEDFEAHLKDCQLCIDEFAVISEARFSVYQWQRSEFAPLETPEIRIPIKVAANTEISWFNKPPSGILFFAVSFRGWSDSRFCGWFRCI